MSQGDRDRISDREPSEAVDRFLAAFWRRNPVGATFAGLHAYDSMLPDWSTSGLARSASEMQLSLDELIAADPADGWDALDIDLARGQQEIRLAENAALHGPRGNPALWTGEAVFGLVALMLRRFSAADSRAEHLTRRLRAISPFLVEAESTLSGTTTPAVWTARALRECEGATLLLADIPLWLKEEKVTADVANDVTAAIPGAAAAFGEFAAWLKARPSSGDGATACGGAFFDLLLARGHLCTRTRADLLADAQARLAESKAALTQAANEEFGSWSAVEERLMADRPTADGYLEAFDRTWGQCYAKVMQDKIVEWPHWPIHYVHQPAWAQRAAPFLYFLHYRSPAPFDLSLTHHYLVPPIDAADPDRYFRLWNCAAIKLNHVVHHGAIGHHVQNWHAYNRTPSRIGQVAAVDCASRIALFCGGTMAEGWACYATALMEEIGLLTPVERLSEQHSRMRFLARAIVDISLHERSMTFDKAVRFYMEEVGMTEPVATHEATKNSMFPGTGLMYWLGLQGILDLRAERKRRQGESFSLRQFHDDLLEHGAMPVPLVARRMLEVAR